MGEGDDEYYCLAASLSTVSVNHDDPLRTWRLHLEYEYEYEDEEEEGAIIGRRNYYSKGKEGGTVVGYWSGRRRRKSSEGERREKGLEDDEEGRCGGPGHLE